MGASWKYTTCEYNLDSRVHVHLDAPCKRKGCTHVMVVLAEAPKKNILGFIILIGHTLKTLLRVLSIGAS